MRVTYHKLVRDQVPAIIAADGDQPVTRVLDHSGYEAALRAKLLEEAHEAQSAPDGQLVSELADVLEVLRALAAAHDMSWEDVVSEASRKRAARGGFDHRIFLEYVDQARLCHGRIVWIGHELRGIARTRLWGDRWASTRVRSDKEFWSGLPPLGWPAAMAW